MSMVSARRADGEKFHSYLRALHLKMSFPVVHYVQFQPQGDLNMVTATQNRNFTIRLDAKVKEDQLAILYLQFVAIMSM